MNRIDAIYSFIEKQDKVVDVGCDQAKLSIMLAKRNQSSIASDISEKVINNARKNINSDLIDLRVSNGLEKIKVRRYKRIKVMNYLLSIVMLFNNIIASSFSLYLPP